MKTPEERAMEALMSVRGAPPLTDEERRRAMDALAKAYEQTKGAKR